MHRGSRIKFSKLIGKIQLLDIDEGIRIEHADEKLFINRNTDGTFVVQFNDSDDFRYRDSARQVYDLVKSKLGTKAKVWSY